MQISDETTARLCQFLPWLWLECGHVFFCVHTTVCLIIGQKKQPKKTRTLWGCWQKHQSCWNVISRQRGNVFGFLILTFLSLFHYISPTGSRMDKRRGAQNLFHMTKMSNATSATSKTNYFYKSLCEIHNLWLSCSLQCRSDSRNALIINAPNWIRSDTVIWKKFGVMQVSTNEELVGATPPTRLEVAGACEMDMHR